MHQIFCSFSFYKYLGETIFLKAIYFYSDFSREKVLFINCYDMEKVLRGHRFWWLMDVKLFSLPSPIHHLINNLLHKDKKLSFSRRKKCYIVGLLSISTLYCSTETLVNCLSYFKLDFAFLFRQQTFDKQIFLKHYYLSQRVWLCQKHRWFVLRPINKNKIKMFV